MREDFQDVKIQQNVNALAEALVSEESDWISVLDMSYKLRLTCLYQSRHQAHDGQECVLAEDVESAKIRAMSRGWTISKDGRHCICPACSQASGYIRVPMSSGFDCMHEIIFYILPWMDEPIPMPYGKYVKVVLPRAEFEVSSIYSLVESVGNQLWIAKYHEDMPEAWEAILAETLSAAAVPYEGATKLSPSEVEKLELFNLEEAWYLIEGLGLRETDSTKLKETDFLKKVAWLEEYHSFGDPHSTGDPEGILEGAKKFCTMK